MFKRVLKKEFKIVDKKLRIHTVPLEDIRVDGTKVTVFLDDVNVNRWKLTFCPFQAIKITTIDCCWSETPDGEEYFTDGHYVRYISEKCDSKWIKQIRKKLISAYNEDYTQSSHHYVMILGDNLVEVMAWNVEIEHVN
jgi:hypothetical protein